MAEQDILHWTSSRDVEARLTVVVSLLISLLGVACDRIRVAPEVARDGAEHALTPDAEARLKVTGTVSSVQEGTHELALTVVNGSRWNVTELRVRVEFGLARRTLPKECVLRSRRSIGPGEEETLVTVLDESSSYGTPPSWRVVSASGYPPQS